MITPTGSGDVLHGDVKTGGFTPAPFARGYFDSIGDYDTSGSGCADVPGQSSQGAGARLTFGYL